MVDLFYKALFNKAEKGAPNKEIRKGKDGGKMRKAILMWGMVFCVVAIAASKALFAQDEDSAGTNWKQELKSDKRQIKEQHQEIKQSARETRAEEKALEQQIRDAHVAGDMEKVKELKGQLRSVHKENVQERRGDRKELREAKKELKRDRKTARFDRIGRNDDGVIDNTEKNKYRKHGRGRDDNPPGKKGGPGINWENPPGPQDGPGASPDRRKGKDHGVRDHGEGEGRGKGQGAAHRDKGNQGGGRK